MRPKRLELDGFTSFREPTVVDFGDADYFALVGPTGSGKSTIIDAICFALYGSVPRYDHKGLVAPVISQGKLEAKVRLDFAVNGTTYTAVRVVRRAGKGASTKEARLETGDEVVAGSADELSDRVAELVGLSFEHFTRCVVLPQGEFARFLHDKPSDRQDLLVRLLNLRIYRRMREEAARRSASLKAKARLCEERLTQDLAFATEEALAAAKERSARLDELRAVVDDAQPKLEALDREAAEAEAAAVVAEERLTLIAELDAPEGVDRIAGEVAGARAARDESAGALEKASARVDRAAHALEAAPDKVALSSALKAHAAAGSLRPKLAQATKKLAAAEKAEGDAAKRVAAAEKAAATAREALEHSRALHAASDLAATLKKGRPCPVCLRKVTSLPEHAAAPRLDKAKKAMEKAEGALEEGRVRHTDALGEVKAARADAASLEERLADLAGELEQHPDRKEIEKALKRGEAAEDELRVARKEEASAREHHGKAQHALDAIQERESKARKLFDQARDRLAALEPPPAERDDLAADWALLIRWATARIAGLEDELKAADDRKNKAAAEREQVLATIHDRCRDCKVEVDPGKELEGVVAAQTSAKHEMDRIRNGLEAAERLRDKLAALHRDEEVAHELDLHLSARPGRFESWIVNEALRRLVTGASTILRQLSNDQYALTVDDSGNFQVVDHHNADERRPARTLSGGETFLASLSLALALADELRDLAAEGAARLDAIFLDEGFGTLDPETLDTVAATVENLAAGGRMVGIVTHVRELAERIPLQFRVRKERTSTIERVIE